MAQDRYPSEDRQSRRGWECLFAAGRASRDSSEDCPLRCRAQRDRLIEVVEAAREAATRSRSRFAKPVLCHSERSRGISKYFRNIKRCLHFGRHDRISNPLSHLSPLSNSSALVLVACRLSINFSIASIGGSAAIALRNCWTRSHSSG